MSDKREPMLRSKTIESFARNATERLSSPTIMDPAFDQWTSDCFRTGESVGSDVRDLYEQFIEKGDLIRKDELIKWLYKEIAMAEQRHLASTNPSFHSLQEQCRAEGALATYRAVKAHIEG